ncbi:peptidoglycan-binding protein [Candidatus Kaiserbacteria bacterium]|nr:peptidoglycan-binding protein [Candidatus Kaiserbacteria bacterium]
MRYIVATFAALSLFLSGFAALPALAQTSDDYGTADSANYCPKLSITMQRGARDASYGGQVSELQKFISDYYDIDPDEIVTGFFGRITQGYVQQFQREQGLPTFGIAGSMTRAAIAKVCTSNTFSGTGQTIPNTTPTTPSTTYTPPTTNAKSNLVPDTLKIGYPSTDTTIGVGQKLLIIYSVGSNIVASDPAIVERKIVNAGTDTSASGYVPVSVSGGTYTFDWTPSQDGKYQVLLNITHNNTTYPARSGVITVGNGGTQTSTNTNNTPSVTFSYISSGNVIGSFANLPANSQIRFVNASTGARYDAQSTMVWSGGSGPLSITIPNDLPNGTYYLRATDYYNSNTTIAQSGSFQAGSNVQTNSVVISSFTASPSSVNAGGAVMFMWSSNLTQNDVSYYGGGCSIEGITQNNVAVYVTSGFKGASGQITFVPPATATYTLRCTSNAKDGSPSASKQVTVNVAQPQTNPVVISSFSASQTSVSSGQPVTFSWNSNLTSNDISYYGGFCNIEGLGNNTALYVSAGQTSGASGSITYTPAFTATYTLRCSAGGKDGSPMDSKQVTVSVQ